MRRSLAELEDAVRALLAWSEASRVPVLIIGGVAVSILSKPRTTRDVDVVAWLPNQDEWPAFLADGERHSIVPRIPDALEFALSSRVLLLRHDRSGVPIDLSMGALPFEENAVRRAVPTDIGGLRVPLPVPEDLLVMKAVAHRSRDMVDIESILSAHADVDETSGSAPRSLRPRSWRRRSGSSSRSTITASRSRSSRRWRWCCSTPRACRSPRLSDRRHWNFRAGPRRPQAQAGVASQATQHPMPPHWVPARPASRSRRERLHRASRAPAPWPAPRTRGPRSIP
ncbi:DUF6036 family nucleotidyltransferase [Sorangium sp. So ce321]|uniref:DUF6036 family nucleotidyltransferase n=1 Tax=Sorangium sp. So ce321 TaxID=3133300 RepID=UPI003F5D8843